MQKTWINCWLLFFGSYFIKNILEVFFNVLEPLPLQHYSFPLVCSDTLRATAPSPYSLSHKHMRARTHTHTHTLTLKQTLIHKHTLSLTIMLYLIKNTAAKHILLFALRDLTNTYISWKRKREREREREKVCVCVCVLSHLVWQGIWRQKSSILRISFEAHAINNFLVEN